MFCTFFYPRGSQAKDQTHACVLRTQAAVILQQYYRTGDPPPLGWRAVRKRAGCLSARQTSHLSSEQ